jgi:hypothetical protein
MRSLRYNKGVVEGPPSIQHCGEPLPAGCRLACAPTPVPPYVATNPVFPTAPDARRPAATVGPKPRCRASTE